MLSRACGELPQYWGCSSLRCKPQLDGRLLERRQPGSCSMSMSTMHDVNYIEMKCCFCTDTFYRDVVELYKH